VLPLGQPGASAAEVVKADDALARLVEYRQSLILNKFLLA
jgi:hypothetical protein